MSYETSESKNAFDHQPHIEELLKTAEAYYSSRNYEAAMDAYLRAYSACPKCLDAGEGLVNSMMSVGRVDEAVKVCGEMIAAAPNAKGPRLLLGKIYYRSRSDYQGALEQFQAALKAAPGDGEIMHGIADIYYSMNELDNAADYYSRAIEAAPARMEAYTGLARVFMAAKDHESALGVYDRAIAAMPASVEAYCRKGDIYKETGGRAEAESCYMKAIEVNPKSALAYNKMGLLKVSSPFEFKKHHHRSYYNRIHLDEAIYYYEKAAESDPNFSAAYYNLCLSYFDISCYEEALHNIKLNLALAPANAMAWYYRAIISKRLGLLNEAIYSNNYGLSLVRNNLDDSNEPRIYEWLDNHGRELSDLYYVKTPLLNKFGRDLTRQAADFKFDRHIGRERELSQLIQILAGKAKNDALIIGEPGVGKTALVKALADAVVSCGPGHPLEGYRIIELSVSAIFEDNPGPANLNAVLREAESTPGIVLFIDVIQKIFAYGDIFKPAIESSSVRFITTTTLEGYQRLESFDATLERKFEKLNLPEPSREETIGILNGIKEDFEYFHGVKISDEAIESAVDLTTKFVADRKLPDKAIDAIDKACSGARMRPRGERPAESRIGDGGGINNAAVKNDNGDESALAAVELKDGAAEASDAQPSGSVSNAGATVITAADIAAVIADKTSIQIGRAHV